MSLHSSLATSPSFTFARYDSSIDSIVNDAVVLLLMISLSTVITLISVAFVSIARSFVACVYGTIDYFGTS